jgi:3-methyladenine DNA glycosylase AlkC
LSLIAIPLFKKDMEPLKEMFNEVFYSRLAAAFKNIHKPFPSEKFLRDVLEPLNRLSLNERMRHTSVVLKAHLPSNYKTSIGIMKDVIPMLSTGYTTLIFPDFVSQFGTSDFQTSIDALRYFTKFGSSEFAIRTFLKMDLDRTIREMYDWSEDENDHVRRLSSEGSRPRLPWSFKLDAIIQNPKYTQPILENLKQDDSLYVRKSVANHINDISKDSPDFVLRLIKGWDQSQPHTMWIIKRGCRSLFKLGDKKSLRAFKYTDKVVVSIKKFTLTPRSVKIGDPMTFRFELISEKNSTQRLMIDYRIYYVKKTGASLPKVFKLKEVELSPGSSMAIMKKQSFQDFTTRKHFQGKHKLEILVNGKVIKEAKFEVGRKA